MQDNIQTHSEATLWFNELYKKYKNNHQDIPWARLKVNPLLETYLNTQNSHMGKALVIGCGLGDDAIALELAGYSVVAIDVSVAALESAKERFPDSKVNFVKQDIFEMPEKYSEYFDFVFEAFTIQSLPIVFREKMIKSIINTIEIKGKLLVVAHKKEKNFPGPPWPLQEDEINLFSLHGMKEISNEIHNEDSHISSKKFRILYKK